MIVESRVRGWPELRYNQKSFHCRLSAVHALSPKVVAGAALNLEGRGFPFVSDFTATVGILTLLTPLPPSLPAY